MELGKELTKALLMVQKSLGAVAKSGQNPHLKTTYPTLLDVLEELLPKCHEAGLVVLQRTLDTETPSMLRLETLVIHSESGETLTMVTPMPVPQTSAQAYGSALTYARRYALLSLFGMRAEDDDAHSATQAMAPAVPANRQSVPVVRQNYQTSVSRNGADGNRGNGTYARNGSAGQREVIEDYPFEEPTAPAPRSSTLTPGFEALPTDRQIDMLTQLGYDGDSPRTRAEASQIISRLKAQRATVN